MERQIFAFRVAKPKTVSDESEIVMGYDPDTQTSVWQGANEAVAARRYCSPFVIGARACRMQYGACLDGFRGVVRP